MKTYNLGYALTIFVSAFLLFEVEPLIAKIILPWFGGSAAVWTTCLLFFQVVLLLGYLYAHASIRVLSPKMQMRVHLILLVLSLPLLHLMPSESRQPARAAEPALDILLLLLRTVGLPYFLLSTTGPLLQAWYVAGLPENSGKPAFPYRLYALSNAGSLLALLSYPLVIEPTLTLRRQAFAWSAGYVLFVLLCGIIALRLRDKTGKSDRFTEENAVPNAARPGMRLTLYWTALSACSCTLLLAVTNHLSQNVAAIPFLWVLPLGLYLLSFILCFGGKGWEWKPSFLPLPALAIGAMGYALTGDVNEMSITFLIGVFAGGLFLCCVLCHGELARLKPAPQHLTVFYLTISVGGALGGVFVGLLAPHLFPDYYELPLGIGACALLALFVLYREPEQSWGEPGWLVLAGLTLALFWFMGSDIRSTNANFALIARNFYGVLRVSKPDNPTADDAVRSLTYGTITHGEQYLSPERHMQPTTYYGPQTGIGLAVLEGQSHPQERVGVIGLGTGTLAAYGRPGDTYRFYDINPLVVHLAHSQFSFLRDTKAKVEIILGDARLSLAREPDQNFDVLAVDAFSGDAIPIHLLTKEAFALYFRHLQPGGVLAVHVSNRYLDLQPVVARLAEEMGKEARAVETDDDDANDVYAAEWVLVTARRSFFAGVLLKHAGETVKKVRTRAHLRTWTDDYSNLYQILK